MRWPHRRRADTFLDLFAGGAEPIERTIEFDQVDGPVRAMNLRRCMCYPQAEDRSLPHPNAALCELVGKPVSAALCAHEYEREPGLILE